MTGKKKAWVLVPAHTTASLLHLVTRMEVSSPLGEWHCFLRMASHSFYVLSCTPSVHVSNLLVSTAVPVVLNILLSRLRHPQCFAAKWTVASLQEKRSWLLIVPYPRQNAYQLQLCWKKKVVAIIFYISLTQWAKYTGIHVLDSAPSRVDRRNTWFLCFKTGVWFWMRSVTS